MRRPLLAILAAAGVLLAGGLLPHPARAEPLAYVTAHENTIILPREELTLDQITRLQIEFGRTLRQRMAEMPGWLCVGDGTQAGAPRVVLGFDAIGPDLLTFDDPDYILEMSLTVKGLGRREVPRMVLNPKDPEVQGIAGSDDPVDALTIIGRAAIDDLLKQFSPCALTLQVQMMGVLEKGETVTTHRYSGDLTVTLHSDGKFESRGLLNGTIETTHFGCPTPIPVAVLGVHAVGGVRGADGTLVFERFEVSHAPLRIAVNNCPLPGGGTVSCQIEDNGTATGSCDIVVPGAAVTSVCCEESFTLFGATEAGWTGVAPLSVPLEDGAALRLPRPDRANATLARWEGSLELRYGMAPRPR